MPNRQPLDVFSDPELLELFADEPQALAILDAVAETQRRPRRATSPRIALAAAVLVAVVFVGAAFGAWGHLINFGTSPRAHGLIVRDFDKLNKLEGRVAPGLIAGKTRVVYTFGTNDGRFPLYATPTGKNGFCWGVRSIGVTCVGQKSPRIEPFYTGIPRAGTHEPSLIAGAVRQPISRATVTFEDGSKLALTLVAVSSPINAAFFLYDVPPSHWRRGHRPAVITVYGATGKPVGTGRLLYQSAR